MTYLFKILNSINLKIKLQTKRKRVKFSFIVTW